MKNNITHKILVSISREANKRGFKTTLTCNQDKWSLYIFDTGDSIRVDQHTKIGVIEDWIEIDIKPINKQENQ